MWQSKLGVLAIVGTLLSLLWMKISNVYFTSNAVKQEESLGNDNLKIDKQQLKIDQDKQNLEDALKKQGGDQ